MKRVLLIDDVRNIDATRIARTYNEGIEALREDGFWDVLYLDHDLGGTKTGYDIMLWLEKHQEFMPGEIVCISANPPGRDRINKAIKRVNRMSDSFFAHKTAIIDSGASIGTGTKVWHFSHVMNGVKIGNHCNIGQGVFIGRDVKIGNGTKIQNNVSVYQGVELGNNVFCGPSCVFTNDLYPTCAFSPLAREDYCRTIVSDGASIGANATIVCGVTLGEFCLVGAGSVVLSDVPKEAIVAGNPARVVGEVIVSDELEDMFYLTYSSGEVRNRKRDYILTIPKTKVFSLSGGDKGIKYEIVEAIKDYHNKEE